MKRLHFDEAIRRYPARTEPEIADRAEMLRLYGELGGRILTRESDRAHMTGSGFVVNAARTHALMVYHNIYRSWAWTGGHADGEADLLQVALREAEEETGARVRPLEEAPVSLEIIPVFSHFKRGRYVRAHLHLNLTYALVADDDAGLRVKPDENSGVKWIAFADLPREVSEPPMLEIYEKIIRRIAGGDA